MTDRTTTHDPTASRASASTGSTGAPGNGGYSSESDRERARQAAEEIKSAAKDAAASTANAVKNRLSGELDYRKYRSRQRLNRVADALRQTGANVNKDDDYVAHYMERAALGVDRFAQYLDERDVSQILHDAREMARRRPEVFVGGLFVAGLMLGRFLRSSAPDETDNYDQSWDEYPAYAGSGASPYGSTNPYGGADNPYGATGSSSSTSSKPGEGRMP